MKKVIVFLSIFAMMIFPFRVLAIDETGTDDGQDSPVASSPGESLMDKYKEFLAGVCVQNDNSNTDSTNDSETIAICQQITTDIDSFLTNDTLYFPLSETDRVPIKYTIDEDEKKMTFTVEENVHNGMTYDEVSQETQKGVYALFPLAAIAMMNGATFEEGAKYMMKILAQEMIAGFSATTGNKVYIIGDDVTVDGEDDPTVLIIKESEFPNKVIQYVQHLFGTTMTSNGLYYTQSATYENVDADNAKIISSLTVDYNMDLDVLKAYINPQEPEEPAEPTPVVQPAKTQTEEVINTDASKKSVDVVVEEKETGTVPNPKTGIKMSVMILPVLLGISLVIRLLKYKNIIKKI